MIDIERIRIKRAFGLITVCACLSLSCGWSSSQRSEATTAQEKPTSAWTQTQPAPETNTQVSAETEAESEQIRQADGVEVLSDAVERIDRSIAHTPGAGSGYFIINGSIAENSEFALSAHPVSVLRYSLSLRSVLERTIKAEIRVYKNGELLVSCVKDTVLLKTGTNEVAACIDTGEGAACSGTYDLRFYLDDCLVAENEYTA